MNACLPLPACLFYALSTYSKQGVLKSEIKSHVKNLDIYSSDFALPVSLFVRGRLFFMVLDLPVKRHRLVGMIESGLCSRCLKRAGGWVQQLHDSTSD